MRLSILKNFLILFSLALFASSCGDDINSESGPKISLISGTGLVTTDATVDIGVPFNVSITGTKGTADLRTLTIQEGNNNVALDRLTFSTGVGANPLLLLGGSSSSFNITVTILPHTTVDSKDYSFILEDTNGRKNSVSVKITTNGNPPVITKPTTGLNVEIAPNNLFSTEFAVNKGSTKLKSIEVQIDNKTATNFSDFYFDNLQTPFTSNPFLISEADQDGFVKGIIFRAPETAGNYTYKVIIEDMSGQKADVTLNVSVGTAINTNLAVLLFNQSGPSGRGGVDLRTGASTGTLPSDPTSKNATIRDEGNVSSTNQDWRQQISGMNEAIVKYLIKGKNGISENFKLSDIKFKEQLVGLYDSGEVFTQKSADNMRDVSNKLAVGDIFAVKQGNEYFVIEVKEITITNNNNNDSYTFEVKR